MACIRAICKGGISSEIPGLIGYDRWASHEASEPTMLELGLGLSDRLKVPLYAIDVR